jgi:hypothetical protein
VDILYFSARGFWSRAETRDYFHDHWRCNKSRTV